MLTVGGRADAVNFLTDLDVGRGFHGVKVDHGDVIAEAVGDVENRLHAVRRRDAPAGHKRSQQQDRRDRQFTISSAHLPPLG
jgi:hypothetical protein